MTTGFRTGWYVIYTRPRHEKKVHSALTGMNINSFLPTQKVLRTWHDRRKYVDEPLFPSYVFIFLTDMQQYYDGIDADGSLYYVKTGKEIARINDAVVENIRLLSSQGKDLEVSERNFQPGKKLIIGKGALTGLACEVIQYNNKYKLLVRVELLNRSVLATMPEDHLIPV